MGRRRIARRVASPVGAAAAWGVRAALAAAYRRHTGKQPPRAGHRDASLNHALVWSVLSAAALALVEVLVTHVFRSREDHPQSQAPGTSGNPDEHSRR